MHSSALFNQKKRALRGKDITQGTSTGSVSGQYNKKQEIATFRTTQALN